MADSSFGLKIGLEGEREFKRAISDINRDMRVLGTELKLAATNFDSTDRSAAALTARSAGLVREIDAQKSKITELERALANASESFGESDRRTQNWQIQLNQAKTALAGMEKELSANDKALLSNADRYDALGKEIDDTVKAYVAVKAEYGENSAEAKTLEARLKTLTSEQEAAGKAADAEEQQVREVTESLGQYTRGTKEAAEETGEASSKIKNVTDAFATVGKVVAGASVAVGTAAVAAGAGMFKLASDAAATGREINNTSQKLGLSREGFQEWSYILKKSGTSIDVLGIGMKTLQKTMGGMTEDGDSASKAFEAVGLSFDEVKGKSPEEALNLTIAALQDMPSDADRTAAALKLFGKGAMELQPLLNKTSEDTDELRQRAHDLGLVMSDEQVDAAGKFNASMGRVKDTMGGLKLQLSNALLPAFADGISALLDFAQGAEGGEEKMRSAVDGMVEAITTTIPELVSKGTQMVSALVKGISQALPGVVSAISSAVPEILGVIAGLIPTLVQVIMDAVPLLVSAILDALPVVVDAGIQIILALAQGLTDMLPELLPVAVSALEAIVTGLIDALPLLLDAALQLIMGLVTGLLEAIHVLIEALPAIVDAIVGFFTESIPMIIDAGIALLTALVEALPEIITAVVAAIPQIITSVINAVIGAIPLLIDAGIKLFIALVGALPQIITSIVAAIPQIVSGLVTAILGSIPQLVSAGVELLVALIENLPQIVIEIASAAGEIITGLVTAFGDSMWRIVEIGGNIVRGLWEGITSLAGWLWDQVSGWIGGIWDGITGFFGIHSPSTEMAWIGQMLVTGLAGAIVSEGHEAVDAAQGMAADVLDAMSSLEDGINIPITADTTFSPGDLTAPPRPPQLFSGPGGASGSGGGFDLQSLVSAMTASLLGALDLRVVLDDGALVGRLTPSIDARLQTLSRRDGLLASY